MKKIYTLGGGTFSHVRNHLALCAPAFGDTARAIDTLLHHQDWMQEQYKRELVLTRMAHPGSDIITNEDVDKQVDRIIADPDAKIVFFNVALCDFDGQIGDVPSGKYATRLQTSQGYHEMMMRPTPKLLGRIRKERKDIFLVAFKTTTDATEQEQYIAGLNLLKANSVNLVLANDTVTRLNMIIVPEETRYCVTTDRKEALRTLVDMTKARAKLTFTRSTVVDGESVDWNGSEIPQSLRTVVDWCTLRGAYKPFRGKTAGHFAVKVDDNTFITTKRKTDFNDLRTIGMVKVIAQDKDTVIAYGAKPSVGGQSQRIVFAEHPEMDCIVHFHCPIKPGSKIAVRQQQWLECGSHECGKNTSDGLTVVAEGIKAVFLDNHGPNIVFNRDINPHAVLDFIEDNFDLEAKTGGPVHI